MNSKTTNIKNTLKRRLFTNPNFTKRKHEYRQLFNFIFPGAQDFINFLDETNQEKSIEYAKKILLRMSYEAFFPPPRKLLFNILEMESSNYHLKKKKYIGRDHFVHLVHLYLFGIYLFTYLPNISDPIINRFKFHRQMKRVFDEVSDNSLRDFIISWRYFILYHDISYPLEYFYGSEVEVNEQVYKQKYLEPFSNIKDNIIKDLIIRGLSRLIAVNQIFLNTDDEEYKFNDLILEQINEEKIKACNNSIDYGKIKNDWGNAVKVNNLWGFDSLKLILNMFEENSILSVLLDTKNETPILIFIPHKSQQIVISTEYFKSNNFLIKVKNEPNSSFIEEFHHNTNYKWLFFIKNPVEELHKKTSKIIGSDISDNLFMEINKNINEETITDFSLITNEEEFNNYCFEIYLKLYEDSGYLTKNTDDKIKSEVYYNNLKHVYAPLNEEIPSIFGKSFLEIAKEVISDIDIVRELHTKKLSDILKFILKKILEKEGQISEHITRNIEDDTIKRINNITNLSKIKDKLFNEIKRVLPDFNFNYNIEKEELNLEKLFDAIIPKETSDKIKANYSNTIKEIFKGYRPKHALHKEKYIDHGIASGLIFFDIFKNYKEVLEFCLRNEITACFLKYAIGINNNLVFDYKDYKLDILAKEIGYTIFVHNIYPTDFLHNFKKADKLNLKIKLNKMPFTFFALLADSLQPWDRKYSLNPAIDELPYATYSNAFDIIIKGNKINIFENSPNIDIKRRFNELKEHLDEYLFNSSKIIELNLSSWS